MLIGREKERKMLEEAYQAEESRFIAIYGRRRVGKTYLVRESLGSRFLFQHTGYYGGKMADELFEFCASLREYGLRDFARPRNWLLISRRCGKESQRPCKSAWSGCPSKLPPPNAWATRAGARASAPRRWRWCFNKKGGGHERKDLHP